MRKANIVVEWVLESNQEARDSDRVLLMRVWEQMGLVLTISQQQQFLSLPSPESITRVRRKLQEKGKYQATKKIKKARELKSMVVQQNMPTASIATAERVLEEIPEPVQTSLI